MKVDQEEVRAIAKALAVAEEVLDLDQAQLALIGGGCGEVVWS